ncbi:MAG TPA: hypothetical protein VLD36_12325 [Burkholderiales bacterium]|jgi:hypothetical protein|nr:hypothetical protein [Burkholderiales bacterium]
MSTGKRLIYILWPAFIVAGIAEAVFFTLFDPTDLRLFDRELALSRTAIYSIGFFAFWAFAAGSSALTCFFQRSSSELNRPARKPFDGAQDTPAERA